LERQGIRQHAMPAPAWPTKRPVLPPGPQADPRARRREHNSWYFYDWANSGWVVLVGSLLLGPLLTSMAEQRACGFVSAGDVSCHGYVTLGPLQLATGSVAAYTVVIATISAALLVPVVGLLVDRVVRKRAVMLGCAVIAAAAGVAIGRLAQDAWLPAAALTAVTAVMLASSLVASDSIMVQIALPEERDRVSTAGWALGYLGGLVVLVVSLVWLSQDSTAPTLAAIGQVVVFGALWWGLWTLVPFFGVRDRQLDHTVRSLPRGPIAPFVALRTTLRDLRGYSQALRFLVAFVIYNDGMQSLFAANSVYATRELGFGAQELLITLIAVQPVAFAGSIIAGRLAGHLGAKTTILVGLSVWAAAPVVAAVIPSGNFPVFLVLCMVIGLVMGGTQSLSRSLYSMLVPRARAAEFFGLYQATERGTSWFGAFAFGIVYQLTGDYRIAVAVLLVFFLVGAPLLAGVHVREGVAAAGNA
jgi:MFS transporter, UMF1 family